MNRADSGSAGHLGQPRVWRLRLAGFLLPLLLAASSAGVAAAQNRCLDGGAPRPDEGGIGGTGHQALAPDDEGGIGGTGIGRDDGGVVGTGIEAAATSGIIGTVTGFASICVGNIEVHYGPDTPVVIDGSASTSRALAVGQVVQILARGDGGERHALHIGLDHVVIGPVTRRAAAPNELEVLGQPVVLATGNHTPEDLLSVGTRIRVSGMRRSDGVIVASHVSRAGANDSIRLSGTIGTLDNGVAEIHGLRVALAPGMHPAVGSEVVVRGNWDGYALAASAIEAMPAVPFDGRVARLDLEGYARRTPAGDLQIGPYRVEGSAAAELPPSPANERVRVQAMLHDRRLIAERIAVVPELPPRLERDRQGKPNGDGKHEGGKSPQRPGDGKSHDAAHQPRPDIDGHHPKLEKPPQDLPRGPQPPGRPDRPDRSDHIKPPDRPEPPPDLPKPPDRPQLPKPPDRAERPDPPQRPPHPDRGPDRPQRPELPHQQRR